MNPITDMLFSIIWLCLLVVAVRQMSRGWTIAAQQRERARNYSNMNVRNRTVTRKPHPEMVDVKPGEQLMGVTFDRKTSCDLDEYQDLQNRIEELKQELEDPWEDDDDGDIVVRR